MTVRDYARDARALLEIQAKCREWGRILRRNGWIDDDTNTHPQAAESIDAKAAELAVMGLIKRHEAALMYCRSALARDPSTPLGRAFDYIGIYLGRGPDALKHISVALPECLAMEVAQLAVAEPYREPTFIVQLGRWAQRLTELAAESVEHPVKTFIKALHEIENRVEDDWKLRELAYRNLRGVRFEADATGGATPLDRKTLPIVIAVGDDLVVRPANADVPYWKEVLAIRATEAKKAAVAAVDAARDLVSPVDQYVLWLPVYRKKYKAGEWATSMRSKLKRLRNEIAGSDGKLFFRPRPNQKFVAELVESLIPSDADDILEEFAGVVQEQEPPAAAYWETWRRWISGICSMLDNIAVEAVDARPPAESLRPIVANDEPLRINVVSAGQSDELARLSEEDRRKILTGKSWSFDLRKAATAAKTPMELYRAINEPLPRYWGKGGPTPRDWKKLGLPLAEIVEADTKREREPAIADARILYEHARRIAIKLRESNPALPSLPPVQPDPFFGVQTMLEWCIDADKLSAKTDGNQSPSVNATPPSTDRRETALSPSRVKAKAAYDYALEQIEGADAMTIAELYDALCTRLDLEIAKAAGRQAELLQEFRASLPDNAETFAKYLRQAGVKRYSVRAGRQAGRSVRRQGEI